MSSLGETEFWTVTLLGIIQLCASAKADKGSGKGVNDPPAERPILTSLRQVWCWDGRVIWVWWRVRLSLLMVSLGDILPGNIEQGSTHLSLFVLLQKQVAGIWTGRGAGCCEPYPGFVRFLYFKLPGSLPSFWPNWFFWSLYNLPHAGS